MRGPHKKVVRATEFEQRCDRPRPSESVTLTRLFLECGHYVDVRHGVMLKRRRCAICKDKGRSL